MDAKTKQNLDIKTLNDDARINLNMQNVRTLLTLRKCRSEAFKEDDLHSDDLIDLILSGKVENEIPENEKYIRQVEASPLTVLLIGKPQIDVLTSKEVLVAYFDATGSIVRNVALSQEKTVFYYAMVVNINSEVVPVLELLSERHDIPTIQNILNTYKYYILKTNKSRWPIIRRVVCDWSWALIIGLVGAWNNMELLQYLNICYKLSKKNADKATYKHIVTVHCCCAHFMKMISDRLAKINVNNKEVRNFIMRAMAAMVMYDSLITVESLFRSLATVLLSDKLYSVTLNEFNVVMKTINGVEHENVKTEELIIMNENDDYIIGRTKIDSPFNKRSNAIVIELQEQLREEESELDSPLELNKFYCPTFFDYLQRNLMPLVPLWTGIMISLHPVSEDMRGRFSNSNVENHFRQLKHRLLKGQSNLKIGRVIRILRKNVNDALENVRINIADYNKEKRKRKNKKEETRTNMKKRRGNLQGDTADGMEWYIQERLEEEALNDPEEVLKYLNEINRDEQNTSPILMMYDENVNSLGADVHVCNGKSKFDKLEVAKVNVTEEEVEEDIDDPSIEEKWSNKRKSSINYFVSRSGIEQLKCTTAGDKNEMDKTELEDVRNEQELEIANGPPMVHLEKRDSNINSYGNEPKPFRVSLSKEYPHREAMSNGLFLNPKYYLPLNETDDHEVALYLNIVPTRMLHLNAHDYASLGAGQCLRQGAVDASIIAIIRELNYDEKVKLVNTGTTQSLFRNKSLTIASSTWAYFKNLVNYNYLIMPYVVAGNHYCITLCDFRNKICNFYNSLPNYEDDFMTGVQKFKNFWKKLQTTEYYSEMSSGNDWIFNHVTEPIQQDAFNCGVYVSRFVESSLKGDNFEKFDPTQYREYLLKLCLKHSDSMCDVCLYCAKGQKKNNYTWVMCNNCKRWIHFKLCLDYLQVNESEVDSVDFNFQCKRCLAYKEKWNNQPWSCD